MHITRNATEHQIQMKLQDNTTTPPMQAGPRMLHLRLNPRAPWLHPQRAAHLTALVLDPMADPGQRARALPLHSAALHAVQLLAFLALLLPLVAFAAYDFTIDTKLNVTFSWTIDKTAGQIHVQLELVNTLAWVGFALSNVQNSELEYGMAFGDFMVAQFVPVCNISDYTNQTPNSTQPKIDTNYPGGANDVIDFNCARTGTVSTATWSRNLNTGDKYDWVIPVSGWQHVLFAHGQTDSFTYHGNPNREMGHLDFSNGQFVVDPGF